MVKKVSNDPSIQISSLSEKFLEKVVQENIVYIRTIKASAIRTLSEALKEILVETNIHFDSSGIRIMTTDGKNVFVHLKLDADKFDNYYCKNRITVGVSLISLHKLLKTISNSDIITLFIAKNDTEKLGIKIENKEKKILSLSKLRFMDLNNSGISIPDVIFDSIFNLPCTDFQKHCRDLSTIGSIVSIHTKNNGDVFTMSTEGDFAEQEIEIGQPNFDEDLDQEDDKEFIGIFEIRFLNLFCKSSGLCSNVEIYLKKDMPILLAYSVSDLGTIRVGLSPKATIE